MRVNAQVVESSLVALATLISSLSGIRPAEAQANAHFVKCEVPTSVVTDEVFQAKIYMQNNGSTTWGSGEGQTAVTLVSKDPDFNTTWGTFFIFQGQEGAVAPGDTLAFTSYLRAPHAPGDYGFSWQEQNWISQGGDVPEDLTAVPFIGDIAVCSTIHVTQRSETAPPPPPHNPPLLDSSDLEYVGSFLLPGIETEEDAFTSTGITLRTVGGSQHLLLFTGTYHSRLYEVSIPALTRIENGDYSSVVTAPFVRDWGLLDYGSIGGEQISAIGGIYFDNATSLLYWTHSNDYFTGGPGDFPELMATRLNADGTQTNVGYWYIPDNLARYKGYWGGVTKLPDSLAQTYTGGRDLALGFGGYYSVCAPTSRGPALGAIARPTAVGSTLGIVEMITYPDPIACPRDGNYIANVGFWNDEPTSPWEGKWTYDDYCRSGLMIDLPDKKGYLAFVLQTTGRVGYDYGGYNTLGTYQNAWYFYRLDDLGAAAKGTRAAAGMPPSSFGVVHYPLPADLVTGSCFDQDARMIYIYATRSIEHGRPIIHAYHIKEGATQAAVCGNGTCDGGETHDTCPTDCSVSAPFCGNGTCDANETYTGCPADCPAGGPACGDGICSSGETHENCPVDCPASNPTCGNGTCDAGEAHENCAVDCPASNPTCGNGTCDAGETHDSCAADCPVSGPACGDGTCGSGETPEACPGDCVNRSATSSCNCGATNASHTGTLGSFALILLAALARRRGRPVAGHR